MKEQREFASPQSISFRSRIVVPIGILALAGLGTTGWFIAESSGALDGSGVPEEPFRVTQTGRNLFEVHPSLLGSEKQMVQGITAIAQTCKITDMEVLGRKALVTVDDPICYQPPVNSD